MPSPHPNPKTGKPAIAVALRVCSAAFGLACIAAALFVPVDHSLSISDSGQRLWIAGGMTAGITMVWLGQHVLHRPISRAALIPGGVFGGTSLLVLVASKDTALGDLRSITMLAAAATLLVSIGVRAVWFGVRGAGEQPADWGPPLEDAPSLAAGTAPQESEQSLRLARYGSRDFTSPEGLDASLPDRAIAPVRRPPIVDARR
jgi:hypothetical protein